MERGDALRGLGGSQSSVRQGKRGFMHPRDDMRKRRVHLDGFVIATGATLPGGFEQTERGLHLLTRLERLGAQRRAADIRRQVGTRRRPDPRFGEGRG